MEEINKKNQQPDTPKEPKKEATPPAQPTVSGEGDLTKQANPLETAPPVSPQQEEMHFDEPTAGVKQETKEPAKETKEAAPKEKKKTIRRIGPGFYIGCLGFIVFLFVILVSLLVLYGGVDPTLFEAFNIPVEQVPVILSGLVNVTFGLLALIIFVGLLGAVLQMALLKKGEKERRKQLTYGVIFAGLCLLVVLPSWFAVVSSIRITDPIQQALPVIQVYARQSDEEEFKPLESFTGLTAPIDIRFSAAGAQTQYPGYRMINFEWDVDGDGFFTEDKAGTEVVWRYEDKGNNNGLFDVQLKMTAEVVGGVQGANPGDRRELYSNVALSIDRVIPTAIVVIDPEEATGAAPFEVTFDASQSYDGDSPELEFNWYFGEDGDELYNDARGEEVTHVYENIGEYVARVRVTDLEGNIAYGEQRVTVGVPGDTTPTAQIQASPMRGQAPLRVSFDGTESKSPNGPLTKYLWNFDDGTLENGAIISHTFRSGGSYEVKLTVTDINGEMGESTQVIEVVGETFAPDINLKTTPSMTFDRIRQEYVINSSVPTTVQFDASGSTDRDQDIILYSWDFDGDGIFDGTGQKITHTFTKPGTSIVTVEAKDSAGNTDTFVMKVNLDQTALEAKIKASPISGFSPLRVSFDGSASTYLDGSIEAYMWDFGDGTQPRNADAQVSYTYNAVGVYTVKLTVLTNDAREASVEQRIIVKEVPLKASFEPSVRAGQAPLTVVFNADKTTGEVEQYLWDFGDGSTETRKNPSHTFRTKGTYEVRLRVIGRDGIEDEVFDTIRVL